MVTARQKSLVEASWAQLVPHTREVGDLFYDRLFELDPSFEDSLALRRTGQDREWMKALDWAVTSLGDIEQMLPRIADIGGRYARFGASADLHVTMGNALLWTLEQSLGDDYTAAVRDAWVAFYSVLSSAMARAAAGERASLSGTRRTIEFVAPGESQWGRVGR